MPVRSRTHHSGCVAPCQGPWREAALIATVALALAGCSSRLGGDDGITGSVAPSPAPAVASETAGDWDAVRRRVVESGRPVEAVAWQNDESGNSGTITGLIASSRAGQSCRAFSATRASVDGVRAYRAELCRAGARWEYTRLEPLDRDAESRPKS